MFANSSLKVDERRISAQLSLTRSGSNASLLIVAANCLSPLSPLPAADTRTHGYSRDSRYSGDTIFRESLIARRARAIPWETWQRFDGSFLCRRTPSSPCPSPAEPTRFNRFLLRDDSIRKDLCVSFRRATEHPCRFCGRPVIACADSLFSDRAFLSRPNSSSGSNRSTEPRSPETPADVGSCVARIEIDTSTRFREPIQSRARRSRR